MRLRKLAALAVAATVLSTTIAPAFAAPVAHVSNAAAPFRPNVGVTVIFAATASVILDAIYVAATQCRELTPQEAGIATFLPGVGPIYNATQPSMSKCKK
jgi:hypothetical protein